ncbi:MAG: hypothetical protein C5B59_09195 [Bacteroidetes bacterium]|nr:MAG: hypothetical protein C5B59_09195 [Bacteroidota bacterium]
MTIAFIHSFQSFLPGIRAYIDFFSKYGIQTNEYHPDQYATIRADVAWHFMGIERRRRKEMVTVHEYASASIPPASRWKDQIKRWVNGRPDYRIFNNEYVHKQFNFHDGVPSGIRDHGIPLLKKDTEEKKEFDFIYVGTVDQSRKLDALFRQFSKEDLKEKTLLVLSKNYDLVAKKFSGVRNIYFKGPVDTGEVFRLIRKSRYGINYIPDVLPFNQQTSAKFLDYVACGIPVITTDYAWIRQFRQRRGGNFFFVDKNLEHLTWSEISTFNYADPNVEGLDWNSRIRESGVLEFLQSKFPGLNF